MLRRYRCIGKDNCFKCNVNQKCSSCPGNMDNQVGFDGFQVSNQCMALVRDDCLVPTIDEPGLGYIRESSSDQYVPDVFYKVGFRSYRVWTRNMGKIPKFCFRI